MGITQRFKQKQAWNENPLFSSTFFFEKEISCFQVHYFTLIETQPTFKTAELLRTNLDWIRLPRDIVKEIMKGYKLEETIWKERKKEKDWGKK